MGLNKNMMGGKKKSTGNKFVLSVVAYEGESDGIYIAQAGYDSDYWIGALSPNTLDGATITKVLYNIVYSDAYALDAYNFSIALSSKIANKIIVTINNVPHTLPYSKNDKCYIINNTKEVKTIGDYLFANNSKDVVIYIEKG